MNVMSCTKSSHLSLADFKNCTAHFYQRENRIYRTGKGIGHVLDCFIVDKGHKDGLEEHYITDTGMIIVRNHETKRMITILIARTAQIKRYYNALNMPVPPEVLEIAKENTVEHSYNY